jgi:hypothetical protein
MKFQIKKTKTGRVSPPGGHIAGHFSRTPWRTPGRIPVPLEGTLEDTPERHLWKTLLEDTSGRHPGGSLGDKNGRRPGGYTEDTS